MQRIDTKEDERYLKAAAYGRSGTGKTSLGVTCPAPLILASERQAILSVRQAAKRLGVEAPPVLHMECVGDYRAVVRGLHGRRDEPFRIRSADGEVILELPWPETIVIDSLTDAARLIAEELNEASPPKPGKDGLPSQPIRYWGVLQDKVTNLIQSFRNAPVNVLFLCLSDDREVGDGDDAVRIVSPMLPTKKLAEVLCAACNLVGYTYRAEGKKDGKVRVAFGTMFTGPESFLLKHSVPLRDRERSDFSAWHRAIFDAVESKEEAPLPSIESIQSRVADPEEKPPEPQDKPTTTKKNKEKNTNA